MLTLSLSEIATAIGADLVGNDIVVASVSTDSRQLEDSCLFVALKGDRFDGHSFADTAIENGAQALLVSSKLAVNVPQLLVSDTRIALGKLGALVKQIVNPVTIAITGSNGKTSVKEMVASILSQQNFNQHPQQDTLHSNVLFTAGNFNNDIGVPLTLLRLEKSHKFGVFELGANHAGEIDYTSALVQPNVALVNNIGQAHLEGFGELIDVAHAKSEIYRHLASDGVAIINADDEFAKTLFDASSSHKQLSFGVSESADVQAVNIESNSIGQYRFTLRYLQQHIDIQLSLYGEHQVHNALAAAAIGIAVNIPLERIVIALEKMQPVKGRMQSQQLGRLLLVDDSYNANPSSVKAAINWLKQRKGYRALVLGDLGELGSDTEALHKDLGCYAKAQQLDALFTLGSISEQAAKGFGGQHFDHFDHLIIVLKQQIELQDHEVSMLVKGSRSAAMERVVEALSTAYGRGEVK
ncbi:MAG: UDP-N-acetylmuramoyl-tripeptide--D-alanyl-D-alanine ligase [Parashewanella sp.]